MRKTILGKKIPVKRFTSQRARENFILTCVINKMTKKMKVNAWSQGEAWLRLVHLGQPVRHPLNIFLSIVPVCSPTVATDIVQKVFGFTHL